MRLRLFQPRFHVNSDVRDISTNIVYLLNTTIKYLLLSHCEELLPVPFTLGRFLLNFKEASKPIVPHEVFSSIIRYMIIIFSDGFGALQWKKMKFEVNFCLSLVSMLSAISWYKAPFISLAVPQFGTTKYLILKIRYWSIRISCRTFSVGWVEPTR